MRSIFALGCLMALVVSAASGQDQEKPRASQGGNASPPSASGGGMNDVVMLLLMPEVHKELGLDDAKKKEVAELLEKTRQEVKPWSSGFEAQSNEEAQKKVEEFSKKGEEPNKKTIERLGKILDAKQLERFQQLRLQYRGIAAIAGPEVAEKLGLSQEQSEKVEKIQKGYPGGLKTPPEGEERLLAVLTAGQKESWEKMLGKKFDFQHPNACPAQGVGAQGGSGPASASSEPATEKKPESVTEKKPDPAAEKKQEPATEKKHEPAEEKKQEPKDDED